MRGSGDTSGHGFRKLVVGLAEGVAPGGEGRDPHACAKRPMGGETRTLARGG